MEEVEYQRMLTAEDCHWWYVGLHDLIVAIVRKETRRHQHPIEIFDVGCGTGRLCQLLAPLGNVTACDINPAAVSATAERGITRVFPADISREELGHECFDVITAIDVLYHRSVADDFRAIQILGRALRPGALLILQVPAFEALRGSHDVAVHTRRRYRRAEIIRLIQAVGFTVEMATYRLAGLFFPAMVWRRWISSFRNSPKSGGASSDVAHHVPSVVNSLLAAAVKLENRLLQNGMRFPFGTSVFVVARKNTARGLSIRSSRLAR